MKYLSVCSGIEAATVAWHGLGWQPVAFAEIDPFPAAVLAHHYPTVPNLGDLTKYREWPEELLAEVELLVGGTPCQAFSVAGQRRSLDDERGNLSLIYVNLYHHINEVRKRHGRPPAVALWENVPGVLSTKDNAFGCFIGGLLGCDEAPATESGKWDKAGFLSSETVRVGYRVLDAQYFGVAQRRRRVFLVAVPCELVASLGERACPSEILSLRESVLGNPPTRGAAWEGVARDTTACSASCSGCGDSRGQDDVVIDCGGVAGTLNGSGKAAGSATQQDAETGMLVACGGNRSSGPLDVATSCLANSSPHGSQDFASETFVTCFHPTQDPISSSDGSTHAVSTGSGGGCATHAVCVTGQRSHALTTRAAACEEDGTGRGTPIIARWAVAFSAKDSGGDASREVSHTMRAMHHIDGNANAGGQIAVAFKPGQSEAAGGTFVTEEFAPTVQAQNNGSTAVPAVAFNGYARQTSDTAWPVMASDHKKVEIGVMQQAVAFKPSHFTRGKDGRPAEVTPPLSADADKGDQDTIVAAPFTKSKRAQSSTDDESWVPGEVAPTQNQFDQGDTRATTVVAHNVFGGNARKDRPMGGFYVEQDAKTTKTLDSSSGLNPTASQGGSCVQHSMQVRRLTPTECAYLQGFPADYLDITFRKKPAADGPKYRALGNSMAVPCMWWLGYRIQQATQ